jgi:hypothetical protein
MGALQKLCLPGGILWGKWCLHTFDSVHLIFICPYITQFFVLLLLMLSPRYTLFLPSVRNDHDEIPRRQEREAFGIVLSYPNSIQRIQLSTFVRCAICVCLFLQPFAYKYSVNTRILPNTSRFWPHIESAKAATMVWPKDHDAPLEPSLWLFPTL